MSVDTYRSRSSFVTVYVVSFSSILVPWFGSRRLRDVSVFCPAGQFIREDPNNVAMPQECEVCPRGTFKFIDDNNMADPNYYLRECTPCDD